VGSLAAGVQANLQIKALVVSAATAVRNCATLTTSNPPDFNGANNQSCAPVDLAVTKNINTPLAREGQLVRYTVSVENKGPSYATDVASTSTQPDGLTFVSATRAKAYITGHPRLCCKQRVVPLRGHRSYLESGWSDHSGWEIPRG